MSERGTSYIEAAVDETSRSDYSAGTTHRGTVDESGKLLFVEFKDRLVVTHRAESFEDIEHFIYTYFEIPVRVRLFFSTVLHSLGTDPTELDATIWPSVRSEISTLKVSLKHQSSLLQTVAIHHAGHLFSHNEEVLVGEDTTVRDLKRVLKSTHPDKIHTVDQVTINDGHEIHLFHRDHGIPDHHPVSKDYYSYSISRHHHDM